MLPFHLWASLIALCISCGVLPPVHSSPLTGCSILLDTCFGMILSLFSKFPKLQTENSVCFDSRLVHFACHLVCFTCCNQPENELKNGKPGAVPELPLVVGFACLLSKSSAFLGNVQFSRCKESLNSQSILKLNFVKRVSLSFLFSSAYNLCPSNGLLTVHRFTCI
jgi:hypothetical protein